MATDADSGDTLTYSLEGRDAPSFDINDATGQILTRSGITLIVDEIYTLTVAADDGVDIARITVTITATAAPPNNAPVFAEGASAARDRECDAPAGTSIGAPVTATDADAGTTLTYSLEGADAASFGINSANGQLLTLAGVTLDRTTYTVEVVANDGITSSRITVTITVTPNRAPVFSRGYEQPLGACARTRHRAARYRQPRQGDGRRSGHDADLQAGRHGRGFV